MPVTNYYTVDGEIIGERTGSNTINYATDALGSVTGTLVGGQLQNTYAYKPYGALLAKTGTGADPKMGWVGTRGYRGTGRRQSDAYVRARHYGTTTGRWTTADPLWPVLMRYSYVHGSPVSLGDRSGLDPYFPEGSGCEKGFQDALSKCCPDALKYAYSGGNVIDEVLARAIACMTLKGFDTAVGRRFITQTFENAYQMCSGSGDVSANACIYCNWGNHTAYPDKCKPCDKAFAGAEMMIPRPDGHRPISGEGTDCTVVWYSLDDPCAGLLVAGKCTSLIVFCDSYGYSTKGCKYLCDAFFHEMIHAGGAGMPWGHDLNIKHVDIVCAAACCFCEALYGKDAEECRGNCKGWR